MTEVRPGDPEFDEMLGYLDDFLDGLDKEDRQRLETEELSMRKFVAVFLETLASKLGYVLVGAVEFVKDVGASVKEGWREGAARARAESLRNRKR